MVILLFFFFKKPINELYRRFCLKRKKKKRNPVKPSATLRRVVAAGLYGTPTDYFGLATSAKELVVSFKFL